jgi:hypothetical protein
LSATKNPRAAETGTILSSFLTGMLRREKGSSISDTIKVPGILRRAQE